jgi:hypothetical protein
LESQLVSQAEIVFVHTGMFFEDYGFRRQLDMLASANVQTAR